MLFKILIYRHYKIKQRFISQLFFLFIFFSYIGSHAQVHTFDTTAIDSIRYLQSRERLNSLATDHFKKEIFNYQTGKIPYRFLIPKDFDANDKYPLVITFHNSSRMGKDNESQLEPLARIWLREEIYDKFKCFIIAPQFANRSSSYEKNDEGLLISRPSEDVNRLLQLIDDIEAKYPAVDSKRVYVVGYSMGASTAQNLVSLAPERFAALVSIAAVPDLSNLAGLRKSNLWLIHGEKDDENPYPGSELLYKKLGADKNLRFTTFRNLRHNDIMIPFLLNDEIPKWLFEKHR